MTLLKIFSRNSTPIGLSHSEYLERFPFNTEARDLFLAHVTKEHCTEDFMAFLALKTRTWASPKFKQEFFNTYLREKTELELNLSSRRPTTHHQLDDDCLKNILKDVVTNLRDPWLRFTLTPQGKRALALLDSTYL